MKIEQPLRIVVRRRAAIGDVIMATGVIRELKRLYGDTAEIAIATDNIQIFKNNPHIAYACSPDDDLSGFDVIYNLDDAYETNPENHYVDSYFHRVFGHLAFDRSVELFPTQDEQARVNKFVQELDDQFVAVHMRNWHWQAKNISIDTWFAVLEQLFEQRTDFKIVCVGGRTDYYVEHPLIVDGRDQFNSQELKHLFDHAQCFVGIDSGPYQCAAASSTHIVSLLTHLHPERIVPYRNGQWAHNCTNITTREDCRGCNDRQVRPIRQVVCEKTNYPCVNNFDATAIAQAILKQLK